MRLRQALNNFVESPRQAVEDADSAFDEVATHLTDTLAKRRRVLRASWQSQDTKAETDQLRLALRQYRGSPSGCSACEWSTRRAPRSYWSATTLRTLRAKSSSSRSPGPRGTPEIPAPGGPAMLLWILLLLLILLGFGIPMLILWYAAVLLLAIWILSFAVRGGSRSAQGHQ